MVCGLGDVLDDDLFAVIREVVERLLAADHRDLLIDDDIAAVPVLVTDAHVLTVVEYDLSFNDRSFE